MKSGLHVIHLLVLSKQVAQLSVHASHLRDDNIGTDPEGQEVKQEVTVPSRREKKFGLHFSQVLLDEHFKHPLEQGTHELFVVSA